MPKALLLGGHGYLGAHISLSLAEQGWLVTSISRPGSKPDRDLTSHRGIENRPVRYDGFSQLRRHLAESDVVFPLVAPRGGRHEMEVARTPPASVTNLDRTLYRALYDLGEDCPLIVNFGSRLQYGDTNVLPVTETTSMNPVCVYGAWKTWQERCLRTIADLKGISVVYLRISSVYGPPAGTASGFGGGVVGSFMTTIYRGEQISVVGDGTAVRDYVYVKDLLRLVSIIAGSRRFSGETFNVGGRPCTIAQLADSVITACGMGAYEVRMPQRGSPPETGDYVPSIERAAALTGWKPTVLLEHGLQQTWMNGVRRSNCGRYR